MDKYHGQGGSYVVDPATGERTLVEGSRTIDAHPDGGSRDAEGKPRKSPERKNEPAMPEPGAAPWAPAAAEEPTAPKPKRTTRTPE